MLFTNPVKMYALFFVAVFFLISCGGAEKKEEEPVALTPEQIRIMELVKFGPDPYEASAPVFKAEDTEGKAKYDALKAEFESATSLLASDELAAERKLKELMDKYPTYSGAAYNLAVLEKKRANLQMQKEYLDEAVKRNPKNLNARNLRALIYRDEGKFAEAEKEYLEIIQLWGGYLTAYKNIGILYDLYMGRSLDALPFYKKYNYLIATPDKQVTGWIVDIERRLGTQPVPQVQESAPITDSSEQ
jgi:tetratricopeptide (TPR) repeat protein